MAVCAAIAAAAVGAGEVAPVIGAPVIGIVLGVLGRLWLGSRGVLKAGVDTAKGFVLQLAVDNGISSVPWAQILTS